MIRVPFLLSAFAIALSDKVMSQQNKAAGTGAIH